MSLVKIISGNVAAAQAARLSGVGVVSAYPITPQSEVAETLAKLVESGELKAEMVRVESEHSAMAVLIAASTVGARTFTATSANGLTYMHEMLHWAAGSRLPVVMAVANRGMSAPWTIYPDLNDTISQRDTGWIQFYCRNHQEIVDNILIAFRVAEAVHLPAMVCYEGFIISHTVTPVHLPEPEIEGFLPPYEPLVELPGPVPWNLNQVVLPDPRPDGAGEVCPGYMEMRYEMAEAMSRAPGMIARAGLEYREITGRSYPGMLFTHLMDDAQIALVSMGTLAQEVELAAEMLRKEGINAGAVGVRVFRPFPARELADALANVGRVAVFDRNISFGNEGAVATELKAALFDGGVSPKLTSHIIGLGGREVKTVHLVDAVKEVLRDEETEPGPRWERLSL